MQDITFMREWGEKPFVQSEDQHRRDANEVEADRLIAARRKLLERFLPFVWLEDQNRPPAELLEVVAARMYEAARDIRSGMPVERVLSLNAHGETVDPLNLGRDE